MEENKKINEDTTGSSECASHNKKVVIITGASSGIGLTTAIYLTHYGYKVYGTSRHPENLNVGRLKEIFLNDNSKWKYKQGGLKVIKEKSLVPKPILNRLDEYIGDITYLKLDVSDDKSVEEFKKALVDKLNEEENKTSKKYNLYALINNAGIGYFGAVEELPMEYQKRQFEVNYFGQIRMIKALLPYLRGLNDKSQGMSGINKYKAHIINISSMAALTAIPFQTMYSASKAAVLLYSMGLRTELKPFKINVSAVLPGDINTNFDAMTLKLFMEDGDAIKIKKNEEIQKGELRSYDIDKMVANIPVSEDSIYLKYSKNAWREIIKNLILSPPPLKIAEVILKILRSKKPKVKYLAGSFKQKFEMFMLRRFLSDDYGVSATADFYGLKFKD
ncbi:MAG: SDR family NAD(P)-dependent oxidoreductase [Promethearchaeota archaeon]